MAYLLDGLVILIFLLAIFMGYRRGFFKSVIQLAGCVAAALIAFGLSSPFASGIYDQFLANSVQKSISSQITEAGSHSMDTALDGVLNDLPSSLVNVLSRFDLSTPEQIREKMGGSLEGTADTLAVGIERKVIRPAAVSLLRILCFFLLFIVLMIGVLILAKIVGKVFRLPLLRQTDGMLGAILGAVQGVVFVFVAVTVMSLLAASSNNDDKLTRAVMSDTVLVHTVESVNPITNSLYTVFGAKSV